MKKLILLLLLSMVFIRCSKDNNPTEPAVEDPNYSEISSENIGPEGGEIKTDDFIISVLPGTFSTSTTLKILTADGKPFNEFQSSTNYKLTGLPSTLNLPIKISFNKANGTMLLALGEQNYSLSADSIEDSYHILSPIDTTTMYTFELPKINSNSKVLGKITVENISISFIAIAGYSSMLSENKHFEISFPSSYINEVFNLAKNLEDAYKAMEYIGFDLTKRTKWPVSVTVKKLPSSVYGYSYNSLWGDNYGYMEFNTDKLSDNFNQRVTAGHEFCHLVQSLYDPRNSFSKAKLQAPQLWLDEAVAVWSEYLMSTTITYVSPIFASSAYEFIKGANLSKSSAQSYGYGMAGFIKYLVVSNGMSVLPKIYNQIIDGKKPFDAINSSIASDVDIIWASFLKKYFGFTIYQGSSFLPSTLSTAAQSASQKYIIDEVTDTLMTYEKNYSELSAKIFSVENKYGQLNPASRITFKIIGDPSFSFLLFKANVNESTFMTQSFDSVSIDQFKKITDAGYKFVIVVVNNDFSSTFSNNSNATLEIKVKTVKQQAISATAVSVSFLGNYTITEGEDTYSAQQNDQIGNIFYNAASIDGNTIKTSFTDTEYNNKLEIEVDDIENPKMIKNLYSQHIRIQDSGSNENEIIVAKDIPIESSESSGMVIFSVSGNVTPNITQLSYDYEFKTTDINNYYRKTLDSYSLEHGEVMVSIQYKQ